MYTLFVTLQIICVVLSFLTIHTIVNEKTSPEQKYLLLTAICVFLYCLGYALELLSTSTEAAIMSLKMQYTGASFVTLFYTIFLFRYCKVNLNRWIIRFFLAESILVLITVLTCEYNTIYYSSIQFTEEGLFPHLVLGHGFLYKFDNLKVCVSMFMSIGVTIYTYHKNKNEESHTCLHLLILSALTPLLIYILCVLGSTKYFDFVPIGLTLSTIIITIAISKQHLFDVISSAYEQVVETMDSALVVLDANKNYLNANPAAKSLFPILQTSIPGTFIEDIASLLKLDNEKQSMIQIEKHYYKIHFSPIINNEKLIGYTVLLVDITDTQKYLENLREMKLQADQANEAKSHFLANMSHEIRTPMNAVIGFSELILQEDVSADVRNYAKDIKTSSENLLTIINDILDISKIESGKLEITPVEYNTRSILNNVLQIISIPIQKKGLQLISHIDEELPATMYGDDIRIRQILINILNNAVKFTKEGSVSLTVTGSYHPKEQFQLRISISDTGIGIKSEDLPRIYRQFEQLNMKENRKIEGTGLGLTISKSFIEAMNGTLHVQSEYGKGTTFTILIPQEIIGTDKIKDLPIEEMKQPEEQDIDFIAPQAKILIVDDNEINRRVFDGYLKQFQIHADFAASGPDAIELVKKTIYDIVFLDQMMPVMDGVETLHHIRGIGEPYDKLPIIALTANAIIGTREMLLKEGFNEYVSKPVKLKTLGKVIRSFLPKESAVSQKQTIPESFSIEGIVVKEGLANCDEDMKQYVETLKIIRNFGPDTLNRIKALYEKKDYKNYTIEVHALKSNLASIGASNLSERAKVLEFAGREERYNEIDRDTELFFTDYKTLLDNISRYLESDSDTSQEKMTAKEFEYVQSIKDLIFYIKDGQTDKVPDLLDVLSFFDLAENITVSLELIRSLVESGDDESAIKEAKNILGGFHYDSTSID